MEAVPATVSSILAAPLVEATHPASYDDDARHYATPVSQVLKSAASIPQPPAASPFTLDGSLRDGKTLGTRFHEDCYETDPHSPRLRSSRLYKGKGKDAVAIEREQKKPLQLLDLPLDILRDIVREVTHTNDLTSLALCHSALHGLAIPHIYSRFDIVWPDTSVHSEPRSGVDALTYGLATLVMAEEIFGEARNQRQYADKNRFARSGHGRASETQVRRRRGNHYAQYTRKFSLGNGPPDWVQEYLITKEGGKMLGTLVALAVARMRALETFIWDMPTGILRDVWLALSSLDDRDDDRPCRLERVWVRWHDNSSGDAPNLPNPIPPPPPAMHLNGMIPAPPQSTSGQAGSLLLPLYPTALDRVEHPSFSVLPALKSLSVLDIDELAYLDEMAVLIGRSVDKLRELRVGIARHARSRTWATVWEGDDLPQVDYDYPTAASLTIGEKRNGGILGALTGFVCDMRRPKLALSERARRAKPTRAPPPSPEPQTSLDGVDPIVAALDAVSGTESVAFTLDEYDIESEEPGSIFGRARSTSHGAKDNLAAACVPDPLPTAGQQASPGPITPPETPRHQPIFTPHVPESVSSESGSDEPPPLNGMLRLDCLELERVPLSIPVLQRVIDWTRLTSLTLLHCQNHEQLWKTLRRTYAPMPKSPTYPQPRRTSTSTPRKGGKLSVSGQEVELEYTLKLKKIHTNNVSPALLSFLKETLAPNSLEVLFLQEAHSYSSSVTVDLIYRGPIKRHRTSLKKVLIDSSEKGLDGLPTSSSKWRRWMLSREVLAFMCSGKMPALRELGMALDYRDWHFFLQHLPYAPHLRSLYIPFLADHIHGPNVDPKELAAQIVDVVVLRPEVELCYMGIANKCYEILENKRDADGRPESHLGMAGGAMIDTTSDAEDDDEEEDGEEDEEDEEVEVEEETESDEDEDEGDDSDSEDDGNQHAARLRLREILFYDDKVAVFKARHGRL